MNGNRLGKTQMYKERLRDKELRKLEAIFKKEEEEGGYHTKVITEMLSCSRSFVSNLRSIWRENGGVIELKKRKAKTLNQLRESALQSGERFFKANKPCIQCDSLLRYSSTAACVPCTKNRTKSKTRRVSDDVLLKNLTSANHFPRLDNISRLEAGLHL